jgi:excisionase family DNA binding protein
MTRRPRDPRTQAVFTVGEVATLCDCSPDTVSRWIDDERLDGFRLPGSKHRRVRRIELAMFFAAERMWDELIAIGERT